MAGAGALAARPNPDRPPRARAAKSASLTAARGPRLLTPSARTARRDELGAYRAAPTLSSQPPSRRPPELAAEKSAAPTPSTSTAELKRLRRAAEQAKTPLAKRRALLQLLKRAYATKGAGSYAHVKWAKAELARLQKAAASKAATQSGAAK